MADREGPRVEIVDGVRRWESGNSQRRGRQHSQPERGRQCRAQQRRPSGRERADCRFLRVAQAGELLPVAMNHMDGVVHADPDRERRKFWVVLVPGSPLSVVQSRSSNSFDV